MRELETTSRIQRNELLDLLHTSSSTEGPITARMPIVTLDELLHEATDVALIHSPGGDDPLRVVIDKAIDAAVDAAAIDDSAIDEAIDAALSDGTITNEQSHTYSHRTRVGVVALSFAASFAAGIGIVLLVT